MKGFRSHYSALLDLVGTHGAEPFCPGHALGRLSSEARLPVSTRAISRVAAR